MKSTFVCLLVLLLAGCTSKIARPKIEAFELRKLEQPFGYSQALRVGDRVYVSGSVSMDAEGNVLGKDDMRTQVRNAYEDIRKSLAHFGIDFGDVIKETVYTTDIDAFVSVSDERAKFYSGDRFPTSSWVGVKRLVSPEFLVEVEVEAVVGRLTGNQN